VSCPEFLKEGSAVKDFLHPDRVVVGDEGDWAGDAVVELYSPLEAPLVRTDIPSAEMVKLASNAFLATKISFINEIANVCEETGADVTEVARGMGLDDRIGPKFLHAGVGFGGSCLVGEETVLARHHGRVTLVSFEDLWSRLAAEGYEELDGMLEPEGLEVLSWVPGDTEVRYLPVMFLTRRDYQGEIVEVRTKMGRRLRCTPDHPVIVGDGEGQLPEIKLAGQLDTADWLPIAQGAATPVDRAALASVTGALESSPRVGARTGDVRRSGTISLAELGRAELSLRGARLGTASNGLFVGTELSLDPAFWRIVGLYLAEGNLAVDGARGPRHRICWSFHPTREEHLVDEVVAYWLRHGVQPKVASTPTARTVSVSSRILGTWWTEVFGLARTSYEQRLPDWIWERPARDKWALLSGLWEGDGSWSLINGGPSAILEFGTISDELADGVMRLLGDLGIVASRRIGRTAASTKDTHWLRISGAAQIERAIELVPVRDRTGVLSTLACQAKRTAPTGYRRFDARGPAWARVVSAHRHRFSGNVYSLEVPASHTFATSTGVIVSNCFPKDVSALKQLAGNSGYHFQLLNAVIEVNELQKRRVIGKLQKHLGSLVGQTIALLGLAFKPNTDDMREASSLVLAARLQADGATVRAYDPVAEEESRHLMPALEYAGSALEAVQGADAVVLVTEWAEFSELDWAAAAEAMRGELVIDGRNALDGDVVRAAGLRYEGVGRR
jgi:UDPglucose 6-dehydrogenase